MPKEPQNCSKTTRPPANCKRSDAKSRVHRMSFNVIGKPSMHAVRNVNFVLFANSKRWVRIGMLNLWHGELLQFDKLIELRWHNKTEEGNERWKRTRKIDEVKQLNRSNWTVWLKHAKHALNLWRSNSTSKKATFGRRTKIGKRWQLRKSG